MANRWFNQFKGSLEKGVVTMDGYVALASDASVSSDSILGAAVTKVTTGVYKVAFEDPFPKALSCSVTLHCPTTLANQVRVKRWLDADGAAVDVNSSGDILNVKAVEIATTDEVGAAADVSVACGFTVHIVLKNSVA